MIKANKKIIYLSLLVAVISLFTIGFLLGTIYQSKVDKKDECGVSDKTITVKIEKDAFNPKTIKAKRCDKLTFYNLDNKMRSVVFGTFENHVPYGEFITEYLQPKERITLKLFKSGTFDFHDHTRQDFKGKLIISDE